MASVAALGLWGPREVREACDPLTIETPLSAHEAGAAVGWGGWGARSKVRMVQDVLSELKAANLRTRLFLEFPFTISGPQLIAGN